MSTTPNTPNTPDAGRDYGADAARMTGAHDVYEQRRALVRDVETYQSQRDEWKQRADEAENARALTRQALDHLRDLINTLPWNDIHAGTFRPAEGCPDVARFVDAAIDLGCDEDVLRPQREFTVYATVTLSTSLTITAATADAAEDEARDAIDGYGWNHPETNDADVTDVIIDEVQED